MEANELIVRAKNGDTGAIDELVEQYKGPLFAFILRMIDNHATAEDIFQDTWLRVVKYIRNFRGEAKFSTWLFQIALNLCRDSERKKKKWAAEPIDNYSNLLSHDPDIDPMRMLKAQQVRSIIDELPVKMREVIILRYYHDLSDREIAEIVGCPEGTVKSRFYRASDILRNKWEFVNKDI